MLNQSGSGVIDGRNAEAPLTVDEWERRLGSAVRDVRLQQNITQAVLARRANIDRTTVARIERGEGGSIRSLVQLARALDREAWLDAFAPPAAGVSPMQLLRAARRQDAQRRVRASPTATPETTS